MYKWQKLKRKKFTHNEAVDHISKLLMQRQNEKEALLFLINYKNDFCNFIENQTGGYQQHIDKYIKIEREIMFFSQFIDDDCYIQGIFIQKMPLSDAVMSYLKNITKDEFKCIYD